MKIEPRLMQITVPLKAGHGGINSYKLIIDWSGTKQLLQIRNKGEGDNFNGNEKFH